MRLALARRRRFEREWQHELGSETAWWEEWLRTDGGEWPEDFAARLDPGQPLTEPAIVELLTADPRPRLEILDRRAAAPHGRGARRRLGRGGVRPPVDLALLHQRP